MLALGGAIGAGYSGAQRWSDPVSGPAVPLGLFFVGWSDFVSAKMWLWQLVLFRQNNIPFRA